MYRENQEKVKKYEEINKLYILRLLSKLIYIVRLLPTKSKIFKKINVTGISKRIKSVSK